MSDREPDTTIAVGTRTQLGAHDFEATCSQCGHRIYFRDLTPRAVPDKWCSECFLALMQADPTAAAEFVVQLTPENVAFVRALVAASRSRPS